MSWTSVGDYFRTHLNSLGLREWDEPFDSLNIPSTILDGSYHLEFGEFTGEGLNQNDQETFVSITCRISKKGYANPRQARDESIALGQAVVKAMLKPSNRLTQSFKNVIFGRMSIGALSEENDNAHVVEMEFQVRSVLDVCS